MIRVINLFQLVDRFSLLDLLINLHHLKNETIVERTLIVDDVNRMKR